MKFPLVNYPLSIVYYPLKIWRAPGFWPWWARTLLKTALAALSLLLALYPNPWLLVVNLGRVREPEPLIQPNLPELKAVNREIDAELARARARRARNGEPEITPKEEVKCVEWWVYQNIHYAFDWDVSGALDYWPTAAEVLQQRREDCDGRAVLSASILRSRGFTSARLAANIRHVWVEVDLPGETGAGLMGPEKERMLATSPTGGPARISVPSWRLLLSGTAFGISVFPPARLAWLLLAWIILAFHPKENLLELGTRAASALLGLLLLLDWARTFAREPEPSPTLGLILAFLLILAAVLHRPASPTMPKTPSSSLPA